MREKLFNESSHPILLLDVFVLFSSYRAREVIEDEIYREILAAVLLFECILGCYISRSLSLEKSHLYRARAER